MGKESIKFAEQKIEEYFETEEKIQLIKKVITSLEEKKEILESKNKSLEIDFEIEIKSPSTDNVIKGSSNNSSYFENNIMKQVEHNEIIIKNIEEEISKHKEEIFLLEIKNERMKNIINILREDYRQMIELRYKKKETEIYILDRLILSKSQYHILKRKTLRSIYNMLVMYNEI